MEALGFAILALILAAALLAIYRKNMSSASYEAPVPLPLTKPEEVVDVKVDFLDFRTVLKSWSDYVVSSTESGDYFKKERDDFISLGSFTDWGVFRVWLHKLAGVARKHLVIETQDQTDKVSVALTFRRGTVRMTFKKVDAYTNQRPSEPHRIEMFIGVKESHKPKLKEVLANKDRLAEKLEHFILDLT